MKKLFIGLAVAAVCMITLAVILGAVLSQTSHNCKYSIYDKIYDI